MQSRLNAPVIQDKFRSREYGNTLQYLDRTLAQYIKTTDGFHLISPQLHTIRILLRKIINIHDTASDRELTGAVYLITLFIPKGNQLLCKFALLKGSSFFNMDYILLSVPECLGCHQRSIGCDNRHRLALQQTTQCSDSLLYQLVSMNIRLKKDQVLSRIQHDISVIKLIFLIDFFCFYVTISNDDFCLKAIAQTVNHVQFLGIHTTRQCHRSLFLFQSFLQAVKFRQLSKGSK